MAADLAIAVVGAGVHGSRYAEHLLRGDVPGARLAGVCRRSESEAGKWRSRGVRFETDFAALVDDPAVDAVVVASPPTLHEEHALAVLGRRKPLLLEKPVAPDLSACGRIRDAASAAGVPVLVGHTHRYNPVAIRFREEVRGLGPLRRLFLGQAHPPANLDWQFRTPGGGALLCLGVHLADLARWFTGEAIEDVLTCDLDIDRPPAGAVPFLPPEPDAEVDAWVEARLGSRTLLTCWTSIASSVREGTLEASSREGCRTEVEGDLFGHSLRRCPGSGEPEPIRLPPPVPGIVPLLRDFRSACRGGSSGEAATLADGIAAVSFALDARRKGKRFYSPR